MIDTLVSSSWNIPAAVCGILSGGGIVTYAVTHGKLPLPKFMRTSINELVEKQIVDDEFDGSSLMSWIRKNRPDGNFKVLVVKPTQTWLKKLNLKDAENINVEKNLIGCIVSDKGKLLSIQLFSFSSISSKMLEKFNDTDEMIVAS